MRKNWILPVAILLIFCSLYYWNFQYDKIYLFGKSIPEHKIGDSLMLNLEEHSKTIEEIVLSSDLVTDKDSISFVCFVSTNDVFLFHYDNKRVKCILLIDKYYSFELPKKISTDFYKILKTKCVVLNRNVDEIVVQIEEQVEMYERGKISLKDVRKETFNIDEPKRKSPDFI